MSPKDVRARADKAKTRIEAPKSKKSKPKKPVTKHYGLWSEWYVSEDRNYFWRARQTPNGRFILRPSLIAFFTEARPDTWDYQYTPGAQQHPEPQQPPEPQINISAPSSSELIRPLSPPSPGPDPGHLRVPDPTSPKSSWPTIITTSTGHPTEPISTSSIQTLTTLPKELDDRQATAMSSALVPSAPISKPPHARGVTVINSSTANNNNKPRRPVGPVMRLIQEGRSRQKAKSEEAKSKSAAAKTNSKPSLQQQQQQQQYIYPHLMEGGTAHTGTGTGISGGGGGGSSGSGNNGGGVVMTKARMAYAKKLHAKVKSEKEMRVDPKRRVRVWLKGVEVGVEVVLDAEGLPVYR